jgi:nitrogen fixation protein FixH
MAELTGRHVLFITVGAFAIIIGVNLLMAFKAVSTFPGLEVKNSYVASQGFNERRAAQEALGWTAGVVHERGLLKVAFTDTAGRPVQVADLAILVGRRTVSRDDQTPEMTWVGDHFEAQVPLTAGNWIVRIRAHAADGTLFEQRQDLWVRN